MQMRSLIPWLVALVLGVGLLTYHHDSGGGGALDDRPGAELAATVLRVVDGDTIKVAIAGHQETIRYIGMDTPESVKPNTPVQCYAENASHENTRLLKVGEPVRLVVGAEARDRYDRLLAYVYRRSDGAFINALLLRRGFAHTLTIAPNDRLAPQFAQLEEEARAAHRGLWKACPALAATYG